MINTIQSILNKVGVALWRINKTSAYTAELYFIKRKLDMRRQTETEKYAVTVYRDFEKDGVSMRGHSAVSLTSAYTEEEIENAIRDAYMAAGFVTNPTFSLPEPMTDSIPTPALPSPE